MNLTSNQRTWYLKWIYAKPQSESSKEAERVKFLREFHVSSAFRLLSEVEAWPASASEPEPGELVMQRWFRLFYLKMESRGEVQRAC
jgi:hypothetical protein